MNYKNCDGMTYTIKQGDTLYGISRKYDVPLAVILRANPYVDVYRLNIGDTICIPVKKKCCDYPRENMDLPDKVAERAQNSVNNEQTQDNNISDDENWVKYVAQPGDTLWDVFSRSKCDLNEFLNKNGLKGIYILPGLVYFVKEK